MGQNGLTIRELTKNYWGGHGTEVEWLTSGQKITGSKPSLPHIMSDIISCHQVEWNCDCKAPWAFFKGSKVIYYLLFHHKKKDKPETKPIKVGVLSSHVHLYLQHLLRIASWMNRFHWRTGSRFAWIFLIDVSMWSTFAASDVQTLPPPRAPPWRFCAEVTGTWWTFDANCLCRGCVLLHIQYTEI